MELERAKVLLSASGWLANQPDRVRAEVLRRSELVRCGKGEWVHRAGDGPGPVYGVVEGSFGTFVASAHQTPSLTHILRPGWWFGEGPALGSQSRLIGVRAMEPSWAMRVPLDSARAMVRDPDVAKSIGHISLLGMQIAVVNVSDLLIRRADRRVAAVMLRVTGAADYGVLRPTEDVRLTQSDLAAMANASRDLVNRTLSAFERRGWVRLGYNRIAVLQPAAVAAFISGIKAEAAADAPLPA